MRIWSAARDCLISIKGLASEKPRATGRFDSSPSDNRSDALYVSNYLEIVLEGQFRGWRGASGRNQKRRGCKGRFESALPCESKHMNYDAYRLLISGNSAECRERKTVRAEREQVCEGRGLCPVFPIPMGGGDFISQQALSFPLYKFR